MKGHIPNLHVITSVYLTNELLPNALDYRISNKGQESKLNQFLTTLHSTSKLPIDTADFYVKLDPNFEFFRDILALRIIELFPMANLYWDRLETFTQWQNVSIAVPSESELILLQTNHDHAFLGESFVDFSKFAKVVSAEDYAIGLITHWPEEISSAALSCNYCAISDYQYFQRKDTQVIGTCLVTPSLFQEWWEEDFTAGNKIVRPDNPFGPDVTFKETTVYVPSREFFRHLDGYGHIGVNSRFASPLRNCCTVIDGEVSHEDWTYGNMLSKKLEVDLPSIENYGNSINFHSKMQLILQSSSFRFRKNNVLVMIKDKGQSLRSSEIYHYSRLVFEFNFIKILFRELIFFLFTENKYARIARRQIRNFLNRLQNFY